jgi:protein-disulfide isomerase
MVRITLPSQRLAKSTAGHLVLMLFCSLTPTFCKAGQAPQSRSTIDLQQDISNLKRNVKTLLAEQQQIIEQLNELRRQLPTSVSARPAPLLPATLSVRGDLFKGDAPARVAIIEYSDFECPFCGGYERETSPQIFDNYIKTGKVKLFYRDLPLPMHPHAMSAARAARCAGDQGKYWEMHDSLFAKQNALSDPTLVDRAKTLGLDTNKFSECFSSDRYADDIQKSIAEAQKLGIGGTPTFFIGTIDSNGHVVNISKRIIGARPYADFQAALDEVLNSNSQQAVPTH